MAANQALSGSLVSWNTVPAVRESCLLQRLHWNTLRVLSRQKPRPPQAGQVRPSRQRIPSSASRQASSVPKRSRNPASLSPLTERRNSCADAIPCPQQPKAVENLAHAWMGVRDNQDFFYTTILRLLRNRERSRRQHPAQLSSLLAII